MDQLKNKEEILKAAQKSRKYGEYEVNTEHYGSIFASSAAIIIAVLLFLLEYIVKGSGNIGFLGVSLTFTCVLYLYTGIKLKSVIKIILGSVFGVFALIFLFVFIRQVIS